MPSIDANFFKQKYGGVEMWTWIAIAVGVLLIWSAYSSARGKAGKPGGPPGAPGPANVPPHTPYVFLLPQNAVAAPDAGSATARHPQPPRTPGHGPTRADQTAFGFEWSPYTVLGLKEKWGQSADTSPAGIATVAYGLDKKDTANAAYFASLITQNNPAVDWSRPLPVGTTIQIPKINMLPDGAESTQYN